MDSINQYDLWYRDDINVIHALQFHGFPAFYPVYQYKDYYSWSLLELIKHMGCIKLNDDAVLVNNIKSFNYLPPEFLPVMGIHRLGGPIANNSKRYRSPQEFVDAMAISMAEDIHIVEDCLKGYTNIILTGGKDSLNLLLLPWKNPVIVASAEPNAVLVKEFLDVNGLPHQFVELLNDNDNSLLNEEILSNCGRIDIQHMRWLRQCKELGKSLDGKAIFWGGSLGDTFMTPYWRTYRELYKKDASLTVLVKLKRLIQDNIDQLSGTKLQQRYFNAAWSRGAMWQAVSLAIHREVTGCLCLSGYHGGSVLQTLSETVLAECVNEDVRPKIGAAIAGWPIVYPLINPSPPVSNRPQNISLLQRWVELMNENGINLC